MRARSHGFIEGFHKDPNGQKVSYGVFVPHEYRGERDYPAILFLHGVGETGSDGAKPLQVGLGPAIRRQETAFPFVTVFPQSQRGIWRAETEDASRALRILAEVMGRYRIDPRRVTLTGISMGGFGTWSLAARYPEQWAAIVPICGGGDPSKASRIAHLPCWCFHGAGDEIVPVAASRDMVAALRKAGGSPRYNEYPGVGHNSWDPAYATPGLFEWMLEQRAVTL